MGDIVIRFYDILRLMVEYPKAKRQISWRLRFFRKEVEAIEESSPLKKYAESMLQELELCNRRKRSRRSMYNADVIDWVWGSYMISGSTKVLDDAWGHFCTESYKIA